MPKDVTDVEKKYHGGIFTAEAKKENNETQQIKANILVITSTPFFSKDQS